MADEVVTRVQPVVLPEATGIKVAWPGTGWKARIDRFVDSGKELYAEVTYFYGRNGNDTTVAGPLDLNLKSSRVGAEQVKLILARCEFPDSERSGLATELDTMVGQIQRESVRWYRNPPRPREMSDVTAEEGAPMFLIPDLVQKDAINTIVADGGGGKSYLALAIATALVTGQFMIPRLRPLEQGPVLYMDFEWDVREHARRLWQITRGLGMAERPKGIAHLSFDKPLRKIHGVHEVVAEVQPILIIVDSLGFALGGDITAQEPVSEAFQVIRSWGVTTLVLHHMNREKAYFGTVYIKNSTRNLWIMDSTQNDGGLHLHLKNEKANSGRAGGWLDLRVRWSEDQRMVNFYETSYDPGQALDAATKVREYMSVVDEATASGVARAVKISKSTAHGILGTTEYERARETRSQVFYRLRSKDIYRSAPCSVDLFGESVRDRSATEHGAG